MTVQMCLLCFTATFLLIHTTKAQGIPGYVPPLYNVPKYVNQGLNAYRQTQQIAKAASGLGLPVPQTQKIVANVALPLIPPAQKLATNVGLPLLPATQRLGANVGLPLLPKIFPGGLPVLPQIPPTFAVGTKLRPLSASTLLLTTNPSIPRISPLQIRSTDNKTNSEKDHANTAEEEKFEEQANAAINPINEASDDEFKEVIGSSGSFNNDTTYEVHQTKTRSPDNKGDELDYLSKAANPIDDIGSLIKKVSHGLKHTMEKIDTTLWPSHAKPEMKVADLYTTPFNEWANLPENRNKTYEELSAEWGAKRLKMPINEWYKLLENKNAPFRLPQGMIMKQADQFTIPFDKWLKLPENKNKTYLELSAEWLDQLNASRDPAYRLPSEVGVLGSSTPISQIRVADRFNIPFDEWLKLPENKNKTYLELSAEWLDRLNANRDPAYRLPSELGVLGSSNPLLQMKEAGFLSTPFVVWARRPENRHLTHEQKVSKYIDELTESVRQGYPQPSVMDMKANNAEPEINPMNKLFESAAKLADSFIDAMSRSSKNRNEMSESGQTNNPINTYWKKASDLAGQMDNSKYPGAVRGEAGQLNDSKDWQKVIDLANQMTDSSKDKEFSSNQRNFPFMHGTIAMDQKDAQFGTHPNGYFYSNQPMSYPYSAAFGGTYNQWNQSGYISPIFDPAANSAHGISGFNNAGGFYKSKNPSEILSNPMTQYTAMFPVLSRTYRQMPPSPLPPYGRPNPIGGLAHAAVDTVRTTLSGRKPLPPPPSPLPFERPPSPPFGIPPPPNFEPIRVDGPRSFGSRHILPQGGPLIKRSGSPANIWDSVTGLADSITNIATNPGKTNAGQILGSTDTIFNAAKDLAGDIDSDKLLGSSKLSDSLLNPINPIGKIVNSATSLGSKITNIALSPANVVNSQLVKSAEPLSSANQAVGMAGQIVNTALNPEMNGKGQLLQSLGPTYAGGFFPRNNPSVSIVNSATQLASQILNTAATNPGNIGKIPLLKAIPGIGNYAGALPLGSIFNSATKLAGDITNVATAPGKLLVR